MSSSSGHTKFFIHPQNEHILPQNGATLDLEILENSRIIKKTYLLFYDAR